MHTSIRLDALRLPLADESVDTIITDPPWHFDRRVSARAKAVKATDYPILEDHQMREAIAEACRVLKPGAHLYVFCPEQKLGWLLGNYPLMLEHFHTLVWVKTRKDGTDLRIGLGHSYRVAHEFIVCFWRRSYDDVSAEMAGKPVKLRRRPLMTKSVPTVFFAPPIGGSRKPPEIYAALARASTPPGAVILDMFAGLDPLGQAGLDGYVTVSGDIRAW
jgi:N6-adenosine-specific RNA methylase IME4